MVTRIATKNNSVTLNSDVYRVFVLGETGVGKSTILNALGASFETGNGHKIITKDFDSFPSNYPLLKK